MSNPVGPAEPAPPPPRPESIRIRRGTPAYARINWALFLSGYAVFSQIYCTQPLLPLLAEHFGVGAAESSLALSLTTAFLAISIFVTGALSESIGRKKLMFASLVAAAVLELAAAFAPTWHLLLVVRALEGVALGGAPAVAMAHLAEEIEPAGLGTAMGLYIGGNALGGMAGRVFTGLVAEVADWRMALAVIGGLGLASAIGFLVLLPPSRNFTPRPARPLSAHLATWGRHLANPALALTFTIGFLAMGGFVTTYNYVGFRLAEPPFELGQAAVGSIFVVYLFGILASPIAGRAADRFGRAPVIVGGTALSVLGLLVTLPASLVAVVAGIALLTAGFFAAHAAASGWIGLLARTDLGHASSLYLLAYYLGSSVAGSLGGLPWTHGGWGAVVGFVAALHAAALVAALLLGRITRKS
ncbi:MAG: MFS transporter [Siculibacillus sp.]|nr:MFS transporter [Siculibacillus sp.]